MINSGWLSSLYRDEVPIVASGSPSAAEFFKTKETSDDSMSIRYIPRNLHTIAGDLLTCTPSYRPPYRNRICMLIDDEPLYFKNSSLAGFAFLLKNPLTECCWKVKRIKGGKKLSYSMPSGKSLISAVHRRSLGLLPLRVIIAEK